MAGLFSFQFAALAPGQQANYVVPAGQLAVVRNIVAVNLGATGSQAAAVYVGSPGVCIYAKWLPANAGAPPYESTSVDMRVVVKAGQPIYTANTSGLNMVISGYLFTS